VVGAVVERDRRQRRKVEGVDGHRAHVHGCHPDDAHSWRAYAALVVGS
jgi:hypothetical protein